MLSPTLESKIRHIRIRTGKAVNDLLAGEYHSVFKGRGMAFDEVRPYAPGDEIRLIDWNVTARAGEPFIKRYVEERDLRVMLVVDLSASGAFGSVPQSKNELAAEVGALLAFSAIKNNDRVGLIAFTDRVETYIPAKKGASHVLRLVRDILAFQPKGTGTCLQGALEYLRRVARQRCVVFLLSDFLDTGYETTLRLLAKRHDVIAVPIRDPLERRLPACGLMELRDSESEARVLVDTSSEAVRAAFAQAAAAREEALGRMFAEMKIDTIPLTAEGDYVRELIRFFRMRERRCISA